MVGVFMTSQACHMSPRGIWQAGQRQRCPIKCENLGAVKAQDEAGPEVETKTESAALLL